MEKEAEIRCLLLTQTRGWAFPRCQGLGQVGSTPLAMSFVLAARVACVMSWWV